MHTINLNILISICKVVQCTYIVHCTHYLKSPFSKRTSHCACIAVLNDRNYILKTSQTTSPFLVLLCKNIKLCLMKAKDSNIQNFKWDIQVYPQRIRLQRRLYSIYLAFFYTFKVLCSHKLVYLMPNYVLCY